MKKSKKMQTLSSNILACKGLLDTSTVFLFRALHLERQVSHKKKKKKEEEEKNKKIKKKKKRLVVYYRLLLLRPVILALTLISLKKYTHAHAKTYSHK
jgi:C4-dicarboxylate transporter